MRRSWIILAMIAAPGLLTACGGKESARESRPPVLIHTQTASEVLLPSPEVFVGNIQSRQTITISTKMMGRIQRIFVKEGATVKKGQLLVRVDDSEARSAWEQAKAGLGAADVAVRNAERDHERFKALYAEKAATKHRLEQVELGLAQAKAQRARVKANLRMAGSLLTYGTIRAPYQGIITRKWMDAGNLAYPGAPILTLENPGDLEISVNVPEGIARLLAVGQEATVNAASLAKTLKVTIKAVVAAANPMSRTSIVKLALPNNDGLRPGQFARVHFNALAAKTLVVPVSAIVTQGQMNGVFVVGGRIAALRWIETGERTSRYVQVVSGLLAGDLVVAPVPPGLKDGSPIEVAR